MTKSIFDNYFWIPFKNDSGETIPAYSSVKITGVASGGARTTLTAEKTDADATMFATTGPFSVIADGYGSACVSVHRVAKFTGNLSPGKRCKPKVNDWVMEEDTSGQFVCFGVIDATKSLALVVQDQMAAGGAKLIKAPSGGIPGRVGTLLGSADCDVWREASSNNQIEDSGDNITVMNWSTSSACANGDRFGVATWCNSAWYIISEDCNDEGSTVQPASSSSTVTEPTDPLQLGSPPVLGTGGAFEPVQWYGAGVGGGFE